MSSRVGAELNQIMRRLRGFVRQQRRTNWGASFGIAIVLSIGLFAMFVREFTVDWSYLKGLFTAPEQASLITDRPMVIDGDTVRWQGRTVSLIGFDAPETGDRARCQSRGNRATVRLREMVATGNLKLELGRCFLSAGNRRHECLQFRPLVWGPNDQRSRRWSNAHR